MSEDPLLTVSGLRTVVDGDRGTVRAVDGVDFEIDHGETVCLVGESGSGKSMTSRSLTRILPDAAEIVGGSVHLDGVELTDATPDTLRSVRGDRIAHVFQNPQQSLDPVYTVGEQLIEAITAHRHEPAARERGVSLLRKVGIPRASERFDDYPHEFSGGMAQRVAIAIALAADPDLLIADEPTTSVDVTVQARLLELLTDLTDDGMAILWITHDLRVVSTVADRVLAMFGGTIVERGPVSAVFDQPAHPYTQALFDSYRADHDHNTSRAVPTDGCRFRQQCPHAVPACASEAQPPFHAVEDDHAAACVYFGPDFDATEVLDGGADDE